jgi:ribose transport system permease protein
VAGAGWRSLRASCSGAGLGAINGLLVTKVQIMPLIVTLGTFYAYNGLALAVTNGAPVRNVPESFSWLGRATWFNIPVHVIVLLVPITLLLTLALTQWPIGRWIYAMGRNERGTRLVGIPVDRVRFGSYVLSGVIAGVRGHRRDLVAAQRPARTSASTSNSSRSPPHCSAGRASSVGRGPSSAP